VLRQNGAVRLSENNSHDHNEWFWKKLEVYIKKASLKLTSQRREIAEHFLSMDGHISAEQLHSSLKKSGSKAGLATVYRTMTLLKEADLVDQKFFENQKATFEVVNPGEHHDHLICNSCGHVVEFESDQIEKLQLKVAKKFGFTLTDHRLELWGDCQIENCSRRGKK
jgi:Fur family ferric uptake transcriptional regulator